MKPIKSILLLVILFYAYAVSAEIWEYVPAKANCGLLYYAGVAKYIVDNDCVSHNEWDQQQLYPLTCQNAYYDGYFFNSKSDCLNWHTKLSQLHLQFNEMVDKGFNCDKLACSSKILLQINQAKKLVDTTR